MAASRNTPVNGKRAVSTSPSSGADPSDALCIHRWEDSPLAQELFIIHNMIMRIGDKMVADLGLTSSRWLLLGALDKYEQPPMLSELSSDVLLSVQNVSRMVAAMEADGLVERFHTPGHGRAAFVRLTEKGRQIKDLACEQGRHFSSGFLAGFDKPQIQELQDAMDRMIGNLYRMELALSRDKEEPGRDLDPAEVNGNA